jgi:hypothetical protein
MPIELGMAMQLRYSQRERGEARPHEWFVMVGRKTKDSRFISDLKGFDLRSHEETPEGAVELVVEWLQSKPNAYPKATKPAIMAALESYVRAKRAIHGEVGRLWPRLVEAAAKVAMREID